MSYSNVIHNVLGNMGSRDDRGGRGGRDRGQSRYEEDHNSGIDAVDRDGLTLNSVTLVESGTYDPEFLRPYVVSATRDDIDNFSDVVAEEGGMVTSSMVAGIAGRIMSYNNRVSDRDLVEIENGWNEKRFSFIIEVIERERDEFDFSHPDKEVVTFVSGFTDCMDIAKRTSLTRLNRRSDAEILIAPETRFHITNIRRIERATRRIKTNNQLIVPSYYKKNRYRNSREELFTLRPKDIFKNQSVNAIIDSRNDDVPQINNANKLIGSQIKPSRATNLNPASYLSSTVNALTRAERRTMQRDPYGNYTPNNARRDSVYSDAQSVLHEDTAFEANSFLQMLRYKSSYNQDQSFSWGELREIFGGDAIEDLAEVHQTDPIKQDVRQARAGEGAGWDNNENSGRNAVFATVLKQTLPSYALESMIYACRIEATNVLGRSEEMDARAGAMVTVSDVVWAVKQSQDEEDRLIDEFEDRIAHDILRDLSLDNCIDYDIVVELNWRFDSFIEVGIEGGPMLPFPTAGFASALTSPIITTSQDTTDLIGQELNSIVQNILGK